MIQTALALAARGLHVFPCRPRDKRPATANGLKDATTDQDIISAWWQRQPDNNIAIATGAASGVFVVDVDGRDAEAALRKLEVEHGPLPATVEAITARGRHIYFKWPKEPVRNSAGKIGRHIDVRGEGGYVLSPPSIHPSGRPYCWSVDSANAIADAPGWLLALQAGAPVGKTPSLEWRLLIEGVSEGARDCSIAKLAGHLLRHHIDPFVALGLLQSWNATDCTPPLPRGDVERIVNSIAGRELRRRGNG
ncbi:bifunctional DNA primase/polymerase [Bradyrhizobium sp. Ec3.3]|uniref:bifunctional DNA primase/polymerase n=1 Tax=Bradyrhizobium sp. Ec3.3 TaxID=189753 RepID=UPI00041F9643|nr:bifunctional DNA primase/polymerase [Bradyrhizobium sp. Ec3.3]